MKAERDGKKGQERGRRTDRQLSRESSTATSCKQPPTWVVVEDDVEEILISPGDVVLVLLVERVKEVLPGEAIRDHAILK